MIGPQIICEAFAMLLTANCSNVCFAAADIESRFNAPEPNPGALLWMTKFAAVPISPKPFQS